MKSGLKAKAAAAARRAGLLTGGLLLVAVGVAFLTSAAWIYLSLVTDTLTAALIIGGAYVGVGLIMIGTSGERSERHAPSPEPAKTPPTPPLMQAFLSGLEAGMAASRRPR